MMRMTWTSVLAGLIVVVSAGPLMAQEHKGGPDEDAILKKAEAFVEAFHKGDAKALSEFWIPDGDYIDLDGRHLKGREAIEKAFAEFFRENKGAKLRIDITSLKILTPDVALEDGTTAVIPPDGSPPSRARYSIVHVKKDGQWYLGSVRDSVFVPETNYAKLRGLEWIIGEWVNESKGGESAHVSFEWTDHQNFIVSSFATNIKNMTVAGGREWIGWDPIAKKIRSWMFDFEGGFGEGTWANEGDKLVIKAHAVTRDGKKLEATNTVSRIDANTISWESTGRTADGKALPDIKEVKLKRRTH